MQLLVWTQSPPQALPNAPHYTISQSFDRPDGRFCGSFDNSNTTFPIFSKIFNFLIKLLFIIFKKKIGLLILSLFIYGVVAL